MQSQTILSRGNQLTIPSQFRQILNLEPGDEVVMELKGNEIRISKSLSRAERLDAVLNQLDQIRTTATSQLTPDQKALQTRTAGWNINQYHAHFDATPEQQAIIKEKYAL